MSQEGTIFDMAYKGKFTAVKNLIEENKKLITETDGNGRMLIHWAALGGHNDLVKHLLSAGSPVDSQDDSNMTPLILASSAGRDKVVNTLIAEGANVNAQTTEGHSALQYAASKNWQAICVKLVENSADINISDKRGATPLHRAASKGNIEVLKFLLAQEGLKIDQQDMYGNTALHLACEEDRQQEAKLLVTHGANFELANKERKTPLDLASDSLTRQLTKIRESPSE
ncbi:26S proteasome non-ATPase regulatory subunit 10-like [Microplitis mediator]|uniref:26S proteasome non-ATPase regulatory subunit 10-like n=1 Tax=Microplitis mediator TaxID=375433 RepID=UPI0025528FAC|nr:26S proteasome non-ATPase regulatory subunit 10-like [Microplitis mediator]